MRSFRDVIGAGWRASFARLQLARYGGRSDSRQLVARERPVRPAVGLPSDVPCQMTRPGLAAEGARPDSAWPEANGWEVGVHAGTESADMTGTGQPLRGNGCPSHPRYMSRDRWDKCPGLTLQLHR